MRECMRACLYVCIICMYVLIDLDSSGDGKLSHHELEQALVELDIDITTSQAHALVMFMGEPVVIVLVLAIRRCAA